MNIYICQSKTKKIEPCSCGYFPVFNRVDDYHTDVWLQCPNCGKQTENTGGYH